MELEKINGFSSTFLLLKQSAINLEKYLVELYEEQDIEELEKSLVKVPVFKLSPRKRSLFLTGTMLCNRMFTLSDSYFEGLSYEMEILTHGYLKYVPYKKGERGIRAANIYPKIKEVEFNRLKIGKVNYRFGYKEGEESLIEKYSEVYESLRNPNTHHAHGFEPFYNNLRIILLSIAGIDMYFHRSWTSDDQIREYVDMKEWEYFIDMTKTYISNILAERGDEEMPESSYLKMFTKYGEKNVVKFENRHGNFMSYMLGEEFNVLLM